VRELVVRTARAEGLEPKVGFEVRSIPAMRNLVLRGAAAAILPMAAVAEEVRAGRLAARRIVAPPLQRTLYLAASTKRQPFTHEPALSVIIRDSLKLLVDMLGPLAEPIGR
jgi:LysR family nitrogen assimilation transcriptional regulator